ncbi:MAG: guanylyltransferase [Thermoprotei archaeon]|nr:MAG: guanylyltransferase [Thermoprotei archaeon]
MRIIKNYKEYEVYSSLRLPVNVPVIIRCDGRNFHRLARDLSLEKPYDKSFIENIIEAAKEIYREGFNPNLIYLFSDEINFVFVSELPFNRRLEKILSIIPSIVSSKLTSILYLTRKYYNVVSFDARAIPLPKEEIVGYLQWRQSEAWRNCINSYAYFALLANGCTPKEATRKLEGLKCGERQKIVFKMLKINLNNIPEWQKRGVLIYKKIETRICENKLTRKKIEVARRKIFVNFNVPLFTKLEGRRLIERLLL